MNKVFLIGRIARDPEVRYNNDMAIAKFTLAVDRTKKGEADFINCVGFGKSAEVVEKYTNKGKQIAIDGHIQTGNYTNKEGKKVYTTDVVIDRLQLLGGREEQAETQTETQVEIPEGFEAVSDGDIPF